jgi:uncharacterized protein
MKQTRGLKRGAIVLSLTAMWPSFSAGAPSESAMVAPLENACNSGRLRSCFDLAHYLDSQDATADKARAAVLHQKACDGGIGDGCIALAVRYRDGQGASKDEKKATALFERAATLNQKGCDSGDTDACASLASQYLVGNGVAKDVARSAALYQKACDAGNAMVCVTTAHAYQLGLGLPKDEARATALFEKATTLHKKGCDSGNAVACFWLGLGYAAGQGVPHDADQAAILFQKACDGGLTLACNALKDPHLHPTKKVDPATTTH